MRTNRKTEEKKMSMSKNIARLAVTAGLTAALSFGGVMAPVTMAFAEGGSGINYVPTATTTGNVTIAENTYAGTSFKGIQIFKATVTQGKADTDSNGVADEDGAWSEDGEKTLSGIQWATTEVEKAVKGVFANETNNPGEDATAQEWADYINGIVNGKAGKGFTVDADSALDKIAKALEKLTATNEDTGWKKSNDGKFSTLSAGYWLFVTVGVSDIANTTKGNTDAYTSPIFAIVGGADVNAKPKKGVPTVEKNILDDNKVKDDITTVPARDWGDIADSQIGQDVYYKLTGSVASNYATYDSYAYKFSDELSNGLEYVDESAEVYALNNDTYKKIDPQHYSVQNIGNTLTVEFKAENGDKGLKDVEGVNAQTKIVVFYRAKLNGNAVIGNAKDESGNLKKGGNPNTVTLEYSNNPHAQGTGKTIGHTVADFAFRLNLKKVDQGTEKGLGGAVFTIQSDDANTKGQYVASEDNEDKKVVAGQLVTVEGTDLPGYVQFTSSNVSGKEGTIEVKGLDAGTYKVTEVQTPDDTKYTKAKPFTFTITAKYNDKTMNVADLSADVSEADKGRTDIAFGTLDDKAGDNVLHGQDNTGTNADAGEVTINVGNTKSVGLPLTGLNGVTFTWIAGGAVLCIGVAHLIRSRKQAEESEQE